MNYDENSAINIMHRFFQIYMNMYLQEQSIIKKNSDFVIINVSFWIYY